MNLPYDISIKRSSLSSIFWDRSSEGLMILDQTLLPNEKRYEKITSAEQMWDAIKKLKVRGAPAIGIAAAFGVYVEIVRQSPDSRESFLACVGNACKLLSSSRPTAVNLFWALQKVRDFTELNMADDPTVTKDELFKFCNSMLEEDKLICDKLG